MLTLGRINYRMMTASVAAMLALGAAGCSDDPTEPEAEPEIASITVTAGGSTVTIPASGAQTPGALQLTANTSNTISIRFRNAAGADEPVIAADRDEFEVRLTVGTTTSTFTAGTGSTFTGTVTPTTTGAAAYTLVLFSLHHGHPEVTKSLSVNVVP